MGAVMLLGLGVVLVMALGRGGGATPEKLPVPKKEEEDLAELDIAPYSYAQTAEPGGTEDEGSPIPGGVAPGEATPGVPGVPGQPSGIPVAPGNAEQSLYEAGQAAQAEAEAAHQSANAAAAEEAAAQQIEAARQEGQAAAAAAHAEAEQAAAQAAAAQAQAEQARQAAAAEAEARVAAEQAAQAELQEAQAAKAEAERLAAEAQAEQDERVAAAKAEGAKAAQGAAEAATKRANAAIAAAKEKAAKEQAAALAAAKKKHEQALAEQKAKAKAAQEKATAAAAGRKAAEAAKKAEAARQAKVDAKKRQDAANAEKQRKAAEAEAKARAEAERKRAEATAKAEEAERKRREAIAKRDREAAIEAARKKKEAEQAAAQAEKVEITANKIASSRDLEQKRVVVKNLFDEAVNRRQTATSSMPILTRDPKRKEEAPKPSVSVQPSDLNAKRALVKRYRDAVISFAKIGFQKLRNQSLPVAARNAIDTEFARIMLADRTGAGRISENNFFALPMSDVKRRLTAAAIAGEQKADVLILKGRPDALQRYNTKWKGKPAASASVVLRLLKQSGVSGYDFVGAVGKRNETKQESINVVARHFKRMGVDLSKPDKRKPFWRQPVTTIQAKALRAANTIPIPRGAKKPALIKQRPLPSVKPVVVEPKTNKVVAASPAINLPDMRAIKARLVALKAILPSALGKKLSSIVPNPANFVNATAIGPVTAKAASFVSSLAGGKPISAAQLKTVQGRMYLSNAITAVQNKYSKKMPTPAARTTAPAPKPAARPQPVAKTPAPKPAQASSAAVVEANRRAIKATFDGLLARRRKLFPREAKQKAINKVAAYLTKAGVPLSKPNPAALHAMHKGSPAAVATRLKAIAAAYKPTKMAGEMGVGTYWDFYGSKPSGGGLITLGGWAS